MVVTPPPPRFSAPCFAFLPLLLGSSSDRIVAYPRRDQTPPFPACPGRAGVSSDSAPTILRPDRILASVSVELYRDNRARLLSS